MSEMNSVVIDVTYACNSGCEYCQWDKKNKNRPLISSSDIYLNKTTIDNMGIKRVVFSGGEPLLRKDLEKVIKYYAQCGLQSILILTNGLLLTKKRVKSLIDSGLTGVTLSIDGIESRIGSKVRGLTEIEHNKVIHSFLNIVNNFRNDLKEININVVISSINLNENIMLNLINFCNKLKISSIKFQPIFDDGYVSKNAPWLLLNKNHADKVRSIGILIVEKSEVNTNRIEFWNSLATILEGKILKGLSCGIDTNQSIAIRGDLKFCFWVDNLIYGKTEENITIDVINNKRLQFSETKLKCNTGMHCYCLQSIDHKWDINYA